jgi:serine/threonine protein kinase
MTEIKIGRYEIRDELGEGGMGIVYLARDPTLGREVALKVLHPHLFSHDPDFSMRFEQEARTIAALEHSHIVPLYEFGEDSNGLYFVMRLMKGGTLRDKLAQGPLTLDETIAILKRVGSALDKAHRSGIIHRDLKPGNILFDDDSNAFLSDFGIVKTEDADRLKTRTGQSLGTPHYMSPEQVDGKELDSRSDIYALGVIFYEMVTGVRPYDHETSTVRVMAMHLAAPIPSLIEANPNLPPLLEPILQKVMAKAPADRYNTANEMVTSIEAATAATTSTRILSEPQETISSHPTNPQPEQTITKSDPTSALVEFEPQKATPTMVGPSILEKAEKQLDVFVSGLVKPAMVPQEISYRKAVGWHCLFGLGLYYVDSRLKRRWIYPSCAIIATIAFLIFQQPLFSIWLGIWLLGFIDVLFTAHNRRRGLQEIDSQKATSIIVGLSILEKARKQLDVFVEKLSKPGEETQKPSYWIAIVWHLLFGFGLFYVDNRLKRKWIYPVVAILASIAYYYLANVDYIVLALYIFFSLSGIWLLSFVDVLLTCRKRRQPPSEPIVKTASKKPSYWKALGWHLFLGFGLFYMDKRLKRKWIYLLSIVASLIGIGLTTTISTGMGLHGYDIDARYYGTDIISDSTATLIFYIGIIIYFVGFLDILLTCRRYRSRT